LRGKSVIFPRGKQNIQLLKTQSDLRNFLPHVFVPFCGAATLIYHQFSIISIEKANKGTP